MSVDVDALRIVHHPAPMLRRRAAAIELVDDDVRAVARRMLELMAEAPGIGLAAPQVGLDWRLFVAHVPPDPDEGLVDDHGALLATSEPIVAVNPRLHEFTRDLVAAEEGCLSLPGIAGNVRRPSGVAMTALDLDVNETTRRAAGLLARCWQHEHDHLDGVLIVDKFDALTRRRVRGQLAELEARGHLPDAQAG